jgi:hypothetical protein
MPRLPVALAALFLSGCGYIGDPLPPLANVPLRVRDLAAVQRGARIIVQFTVPETTTEEEPIPTPVRLDLRGGPSEPFDENRWAESARQIPPGSMTGNIMRCEIPVAGWTGKDVVFGVRVVAGNGKNSGWSNFVVVAVVAPPVQPSGLAAVATGAGVRLTWQAAGSEFRVFRKGAEPDYALLATVQKPEWVDGTAEFGNSYSYLVQTVARNGDKIAESDLSEAISIKPVDTFPPAVPAGLHGSAAPNSIELDWDRNAEADFAVYRIYRALGGGAFERIAEASVPSYSDHAVEAGKTYRYSVTAVDRSGNESARSTVLEVPLNQL